jgi:hypothetical protein
MPPRATGEAWGLGRIRALAVLGAVWCTLAACDGTSAGSGGQTIDDYAALEGQLLGLFDVASNGVLDTSAAKGLQIEVDEEAMVLHCTFIDELFQTVEGPVVLGVNPGTTPDEVRFRAEDVTLFGMGGLVFEVGLGNGDPAGPSLSLLFYTPATGLSGLLNLDDELVRRKGHLSYWRDTLVPDQTLSDVERFGFLVQHVVDVNLPLNHTNPQPEILLDLADIFVPHDWAKVILFGGFGYVITPESGLLPISDPGVRPGGKPFTGFQPILQGGEGRFRHFAANALMSNGELLTFGVITNLAGRLAGGGDFEFLTDRDGDIRADLATNAIGRAFPSVLADAFRDGSITDRHSVKDWIVEQFGNKPPEMAHFSMKRIGTAIHFEAVAHDPEFAGDVDPVRYGWKLSGPAQGCGIFTPIGSGTLIWDIEGCNEEDVAETLVIVTATDAGGGRVVFAMPVVPSGELVLGDPSVLTPHVVLSDADPFGVNRPPRLLEFRNLFVPDAHSNFYKVHAVDPELGPLTYEWAFFGAGAGCGVVAGSDQAACSWNHEGCDGALEHATQVRIIVRDATGIGTMYIQGARDNEDGMPILNPGGP